MFKYLPLFTAYLRRKPLRTSLTLASIVVAFLLFGLLKTLQTALELGSDFAGADRLITMHRMTLIQLFPRSYLNRIEAIDGVTGAVSFNWIGGIYQDDRNQIGVMSTDPELFVEVYPEYRIPEEQQAAWFANRDSIVVGTSLVERFGWEIGQTIPIRSSYYTQTDGSSTWEFEIAGIYEADNGDNGSAYFHYEYLNQSIGEPNMIGFVALRVEEPSQATEVANRVDALFANSPAETKTATESAFIQGFANQMGDIGAIVTAVVTAVLFTILLVTGNTMAQSVRERTSEFAVLKTLGFSSLGVSMLVLAESFFITALGGAIGLALSAVFAEEMSSALEAYFPVIGVPASAYITGAVLIVVLAVLAALLPSLQAGRLRITDALRTA